MLSSPSARASPSKMSETLLPSPKEQFQDRSSQPILSSPSARAGPSKMSEANRLLSTPDNAPISMELNEPCDSKKLNIPDQEGQRYQLYTSLRELVTKVVSQLRKSISDELLNRDPISSQLHQNNDEITKTSPPSSAEVKFRAKTTLVGEETVSFLLPPDCLIGTDLEKNIQHQPLFEERLQGWHIACRQRANGKLDMSYRHGQSRRMFRSTVEVVEFIMEALITKETRGSGSLQEQDPATAMKGSLNRKMPSSNTQKAPPSKSLKISIAEKIAVERFLLESHNNLNKICGSRWVEPGREEWETYLKPSSENEDDASGDAETW